MKYKLIAFLTILWPVVFLACEAQEIGKIDKYDKGERKIKAAPFGLGNEITMGKVLADGSIIIELPEIDLANHDVSKFFMDSLQRTLGMGFCDDKKIDENNTEIKTINTNLFLYKYDQSVGALLPTTHKDLNAAENGLIIGSSISWFYSDGDGKFKAKCTVYERKTKQNGVDEIDKNNIRKITTYDITFKKGWNLVEHSLLELKDQKRGKKVITTKFREHKATIYNIPRKINWHMKYWAKD